MSRRRRERAFAATPAEPLDRERTLARFRHLAGRSATFGFLPWGPVVEARTPKQLVDAVERALVAEVGQERPS